MAATLVGGAFLSATVQTLADKLSSTEFRDYLRNRKLSVSLLAELKTTLLTLHAVLDDAEQKQIINPAVKQWLDDLKDAIFDAEDLINEVSYDSLRCKVENKEAEKNITNQVWNLLSSPFKNFYGEINSQMKIMCQRLQLFAKPKDILGLQTVSGRVSCRTPSTSMVNESVMVGRKDDKERLMDMLLSDSGTSNNDVGVVAILGMGGVGKTTLAQLLYNDKEVQEHFDLKAWACMSEDFDILRVTKTLLESITSRTWESNNLDFLRVELKKNLRNKSFLFVLDDLWNDKYNDWDELITPLRKSGSRVIITTRNQKVAEITHTFPIHKLEPLLDEDCWHLLSKHAFGSKDFCGSKYPNLEAIGRKIAKKCGGLPIAAKTLGGLLRSKVDAKVWTTILNSNIWELPNDDILPALFLSYQYLPSHLKRCFAYCSIFPKDYPLCRKQLVLLWMAEGFLEESKGEKAVEEVGDDYFVELLSRSLIQQLNDDYRGEKFVMHDLVHDLAMIVSGKSSCRLECSKISENVRHLTYNQEYYDISKKFEICHKFKCLRSFLSLHPSPFGGFLSRKVVFDLLPTLKILRVLSLSWYTNITVLPDSIGSLVQLRYLDLSNTGIKNLPDTICNLYNLQTLILSWCKGLTELPIHIGKLVNLRHLDISGTGIKEMPMQIVELESLQTLNVFVVGKQEAGLSVKELRKFPHLQGKLSIKNLCDVINVMEACDANLKGKEQIEELLLEWSKETEDSQKEKVVLDMLQPSINLKKLTIKSYGGTYFPSWLGDSSFSNMVYLCISCCNYCVTLPPLGQLPSLKDLEISDMTLETIGPEFYGSSSQPFPSLEHLGFSKMSNWKEWLPFESCKFPFPRLKTLNLYMCPQLRGHLPNHLPSLEKFRLRGCDHLLETPPSLHWLSSIKNIFIDSKSTERTQCSLLGSDSPCLLQQVTMWSCYMPLSLPKMILSSTCLQKLELSGIPSLTAFPADGLPTSLKSLKIQCCENLAFPPPETWSNHTSLVSLDITDSCNSLTSFPLDGFPSLRSLRIDSCSSLESIFISESSSLRPSSLQSLQVWACDVLRSLPQRMDTLIALERLYLHSLPKLEWSFSEGDGLPSKLESIMIQSLPLTPITEWGLQGLTALSELFIEGDDDVVNALLKEQLLPTGLVTLIISKLLETKSLEGNGLRHLSSLEHLTFRACPRLESLPKDMLPSSLKKLAFVDCPRLQPLPAKDSLPSSLTLLRIMQCPLLEARYESQRGEHWSNIAHIPVININGEVII